MEKTWKANEKQVAFMDVLKENGAMTLRQASKALGFEVKSGTVNTLVSKGLVKTADVELNFNKVDVATGEVLGKGKMTVKTYSLVKKDAE